MTREAKLHIAKSYPRLGEFLARIGDVEPLTESAVAIPDAISRIVIGQMLSAHAARTIRQRAYEAANLKQVHVWKLDQRVLRRCGLSVRKVRAIKEFGRAYQRNPDRYEHWRTCPWEQASAEVAEHWGLSHWSAAMLGIFYFGREDIFPQGDGTIARAIDRLIRLRVLRDRAFDGGRASPYRSYLALYFWRAIDEGIL